MGTKVKFPARCRKQSKVHVDALALLKKKVYLIIGFFFFFLKLISCSGCFFFSPISFFIFCFTQLDILLPPTFIANNENAYC